MKIKKLVFIFENCERVYFDGKYIGEIGIRKIREKLMRVALNMVYKFIECSEFYIEIHKDANQPYQPFGVGNSVMPFTRLLDNQDIYDIEIEYENNNGETSIHTYTAKWKENNNGCNDLQDSCIGENGNLYLKIGKKKIDRYFLPGAMTFDNWMWEE